MPTMHEDRTWGWWLETIVWGLLVGLPVVAVILMLYWLATSGG